MTWQVTWLKSSQVTSQEGASQSQVKSFVSVGQASHKSQNWRLESDSSQVFDSSPPISGVEPLTALCRSPGVFSPVPVESRVLEGKRTTSLLATRETVHPAPAGRKDSSGRTTFGSGSSPSMQRDPPGLRQSVPTNLRPPLHAASTPPEGVLTWRGDPLLGSAHQEYKLLLMRSGVGTPKKKSWGNAEILCPPGDWRNRRLSDCPYVLAHACPV